MSASRALPTALTRTARPRTVRSVAVAVALAVVATVAALLPAATPTARAAGEAPDFVTLRSLDGGFSHQPWLMSGEGVFLRRITAQSALTQPAVSPDGSTLVFSGPVGNEDSLGRYALFTVGIDGSGLRQVTNPPFGDLDPAWSSDGQFILFTRNVNGGLTTACCTIFEIARDGSQLHAIPNTPSGRQPTFAPDGGSLVYVGPGGLRTVRIDGVGDRLLAAGSFADPEFSPDGRSVAVTLQRSAERSDLGVVDLPGGGVRTVATSGGRVEDPQWTADSRSIYFVDHAGQGYLGRQSSTVRAADAVGGGLRQVARPAGEIVELATTGAPHTVFGSLDLATRSPGALRVAGWAVDPDTAGPVSVVVTVDGVSVEESPADGDRPDVAQAYPGAGAAHGYDRTVAVGDGTHRVCVVARDAVAPGAPLVELGCATLSGSPFGVVEALRRAPGGLEVIGWTVDPDTTGAVRVDVSVDGALVRTLTADGSRPDVGRAVPGAGDDHGFRTRLAVSAGTHQVCLSARDTSGRSPAGALGCRTVVIDPLPFGSLDQVRPAPGGVTLAGWALDPDVDRPVQVHAYVDGRLVEAFVADGSRPDVAAAYPEHSAARGFVRTLPVPAGRHEVCLYLINDPSGPNPALRCTVVERSDVPVGSLDLAARSGGGTRVAGWALDPDTAAPVTVHVYVDGRLVQGVSARAERPDVAAAYPGWGPQHGFDVVVPAQGGQVCVYAINTPAGGNPLLGCRTT